MNIGKRIKERRKELGLSVDDVAIKLNKNRATIYRYESNDIEKLPVDILEPLAKVLNTTPAYLMGWNEIEETLECNTLSKNEIELLNKYNKLNDLGKNRLLDYSNDLISTPKYLKESFLINAAHNDDLTDEEKATVEEIIKKTLGKIEE